MNVCGIHRENHIRKRESKGELDSAAIETVTEVGSEVHIKMGGTN